MAAKETSTTAVLPQVVPATDAYEIVQLVHESLQPLALVAGPLVTSAFAYRSETQTGTARKDFLEGLVIALLGFAIGLAVGAALCMSRR
jgi:hypothetical protein